MVAVIAIVVAIVVTIVVTIVTITIFVMVTVVTTIAIATVVTSISIVVTAVATVFMLTSIAVSSIASRFLSRLFSRFACYSVIIGFRLVAFSNRLFGFWRNDVSVATCDSIVCVFFVATVTVTVVFTTIVSPSVSKFTSMCCL